MITMAIINRIKNEYFRNGKSISEIARVTGHDRKTVRKTLRQKGFAVKEPSCKKDKPHCILVSNCLSALS
jgi:predicted transcriptional regulator